MTGQTRQTAPGAAIDAPLVQDPMRVGFSALVAVSCLAGAAVAIVCAVARVLASGCAR